MEFLRCADVEEGMLMEEHRCHDMPKRREIL